MFIGEGRWTGVLGRSTTLLVYNPTYEILAAVEEAQRTSMTKAPCLLKIDWVINPEILVTENDHI